MDTWEEIENFFSTAWEQISNEPVKRSNSRGEHENKEIYFTRHFYHCAEQHGVSEEDALDVYHYGEAGDTGEMVREYPDWEIGVTYFIDSQTGRLVITSIWKQETRE